MSTKQPCKNHPSYTYSGKESSPLGLGYSAEAEDPGTVMEGRDKTMWIVGIRNSVKVWNRVPTEVLATVTKPMKKEEVVIPPQPVVVEEKKKAAPRKKVEVEEAPVAATIAKEEEPIVPVPAPSPVEAKKKAPPRKKAEDEQKVVIEEPIEKKEEEAPKKRAPPKKKVVVEEPKEEEKKADAEEVVEPPKKKAPPKKKVVVEEPVEKKEEEEVPKKKAPPKKKVVADEPKEEEGEKKKKAPNDFNIYMSYRTEQLKTEKPEMDHKERFKQATFDWGKVDPSMKKEIIDEAKAWLAVNKKK
jgi:hypothetical protein